jgi:hypothetical protein
MTLLVLVAETPHLPHFALELAVGVGVDREAHRLTGFDLADVGFVHRQHDLHLRQVFGDLEQHRRLQAGGHGLAGFHRAIEHHAVDRRANHRAR